MDSSLILADLREQFGAKKAVLYAEELAVALNRTPSAIYTLNSRNALPVPCLKVGGRLAVSIYDVANWLAGNAPKVSSSKSRKQAEVSIPEPRRRKESLGKFLMQVQAQQGFLAELGLSIQRQLDEAVVATPGLATSQANFDEQPDLFYVDADGLVLAYARDEGFVPPVEIGMEWLTWIDALAKPWNSENSRLDWLSKAECASPGSVALVEADRRATLSRI